jgi:hypothetical protein
MALLLLSNADEPSVAGEVPSGGLHGDSVQLVELAMTPCSSRQFARCGRILGIEVSEKLRQSINKWTLLSKHLM